MFKKATFTNPLVSTDRNLTQMETDKKNSMGRHSSLCNMKMTTGRDKSMYFLSDLTNLQDDNDNPLDSYLKLDFNKTAYSGVKKPFDYTASVHKISQLNRYGSGQDGLEGDSNMNEVLYLDSGVGDQT